MSASGECCSGVTHLQALEAEWNSLQQRKRDPRPSRREADSPWKEAVDSFLQHCDVAWEELVTASDAPCKAQIQLLKGRALDLLPEYCEEAEMALTRAVKLDPDMHDGWVALGHVLWKKGDLSGSQNCFRQALEKQEDSVEANRELSRVLRHSIAIQAKSPKDVDSMVEESMRLAKKALVLDFEDGRSWSAVANCFLSQFMHVSMKVADLHRSLDAFRSAVQLPPSSEDPDVHFNCGTVHLYLQQFQDSYECFRKALTLDPSFEEADDALSRLRNIRTVMESARHTREIRPKLRSKLEKAMGSSIESHAMLQELEWGSHSPSENQGCALVAALLHSVSPKRAIPTSFLAADQNGTRFLLSVYGVNDSALFPSHIVTILNPIVVERSLDFHELPTQSIPVVLVMDPIHSLLVSGLPLPAEAFSVPTCQLRAFDR